MIEIWVLISLVTTVATNMAIFEHWNFLYHYVKYKPWGKKWDFLLFLWSAVPFANAVLLAVVLKEIKELKTKR